MSTFASGRFQWKSGFYGGKFFPFHNGHRFCIETAAAECETVTVILFYHCEEEDELFPLVGDPNVQKMLLPAYRRRQVRACCESFPDGRVRFAALDAKKAHQAGALSGKSSWDSETEHVLRLSGGFEAVYSSEPSYAPYFQRAYPFAVHRLVDVPRIHVPISGTRLREMAFLQARIWTAQPYAEETNHDQ